MYPGRPRSARESIDEDVSTAVLFLPLKGFYFDEIRAGRNRRSSGLRPTTGVSAWSVDTTTSCS